MQGLGVCFSDKEILVWHLFSLDHLMPILRYFIYSQVGKQDTLLCRVA